MPLSSRTITETVYQKRFPKNHQSFRRDMWHVLYRDVFSRFIKPHDTVMDMGAGYCEFINSVRCKKKIAVDVNPDTRSYAHRDVLIVRSRAQSIPISYNGTVHVIFMSNFLEHLHSQNEVIDVLMRAHALLVRGGKLLILQPNIDLVKEHYWDFIDHHIALNGRNLHEALAITGFSVDEYTERFLPYTTKSRFPRHKLLVHWYLRIPSRLRPFAGQSFIVARKS